MDGIAGRMTRIARALVASEEDREYFDTVVRKSSLPGFTASYDASGDAMVFTYDGDPSGSCLISFGEGGGSWGYSARAGGRVIAERSEKSCSRAWGRLRNSLQAYLFAMDSAVSSPEEHADRGPSAGTCRIDTVSLDPDTVEELFMGDAFDYVNSGTVYRIRFSGDASRVTGFRKALARMNSVGWRDSERMTVYFRMAGADDLKYVRALLSDFGWKAL